jgi:MFS family permease
VPVEAEARGAASGTFRAAWEHRRWRWSLASWGVSATGEFLGAIALAVFLIESTGSAGWVAASVAIRMAVYMLLSPFGGAVADRFDRRRLMLTIDALQVVLLLALAAVAWTAGPPLLAVAVATSSAVLTVPYRPASIAVTPALVTEDDLAAANAAESIVGQIAIFAGPALGAAIIAFADTGTALAVNAVAFALSALFVSRIGHAGGGSGGSNGRPSVVRDTVEGARMVRRNGGLVVLTVFMATGMFAFGVVQVLYVVAAEARFGMGASGVGVLMAAVGIGGLLVAPVAARLAGARVGMVAVASGVLLGVPMMALVLVDDPGAAVFVLLFQGAGMISLDIAVITMLQRAVPEAMLARVYGLTDSASGATQLVGSLLAPAFVNYATLEVGLAVSGGLVVAISLLLAPAMLALGTRLERERRRVLPLVQRLATVPIFGSAPRASLERIARATRTVSLPVGAVVFREGDAPDELYVIDRGAALVSTSALGVVARLERDEWFGEIGLLRGIPRTATVTAETDVELLAVPGGVFVDALTTGVLLADPVRRKMAVRLRHTNPSLAEEPA